MNDLFSSYHDIIDRIHDINPEEYAKTRNYLNGKVTGLGPYLTHGVISTRLVSEIVLSHHSAKNSFKLLQELAWREFFHRIWQDKGDAIFNDLRQKQSGVISNQIPKVMLDASTGIHTIDESLKELFETGRIHNHTRMWVASMICNLGKTHWQEPAKWFYYHLLDGDLASNTLSWQWIAGAFSHKKYYANQENLNKYSLFKQVETFIDTSYESLEKLELPTEFNQRSTLNFESKLPETTLSEWPKDDVLLHSIWNLDPTWMVGHKAHRILLIEPSHFKKHPISLLRWEFILHGTKQISEIDIFVSDFEDLPLHEDQSVTFREYPEVHHWKGIRTDRDWLCPMTKGYFKNFYSYWKQASKELDLK